MKKKTNILCVITDDQGAWAMGCSGNQEIRTPTLNHIAESGIRFDNCFCVSPVCSPARTSIFTGKIPSQHGVHDWLAKGYLDSSSLNADLREQCRNPDAPWYYNWPRTELSGDTALHYLENHKTFTEVLADHGYECGISGKWHMGDSAKPQAGFSYWQTTACGAENYMYPVVWENGEMVLKHNHYVTDLITDNAIRFLDQRDTEKPFYLSVHYTAPHSPWAAVHHPEEYISIYKDCPFESVPNLPHHPWSPFYGLTLDEWNSKEHKGIRFSRCTYSPANETLQEYRRESLTGYYAAVTAMDASLGRILHRLEKDGLLEDTLIIFTSDNGSNMGHHGIWGKGNGTCPVNMYDTSVKIPALFSCPGRIRPGQVCHEMVSHYDFYETILDFVGIPFEKQEDMPGISFAPILTGECEHVRDSIVVFDEYGPCRMIRSQEWKLVLRYPDGPNELYHLTEDPGEDNNLYHDPAYAELTASMSAQLRGWFEKYVDPRFDGSKEKVTGKGQLTSHSFVQ